MRYPKDHKAKVRDKLVRTSAALAKSAGFGTSGVDALAAAADLTSGAFYRHFAGKDELLAEIVATEIGATRARFAMLPARSREHLMMAVDLYLTMAHVRHPEAGCPLPALASEVGRSTTVVKSAFERAMHELTAVLEDKLGDRAAAWALVAQCVGAVMIARGLETESARRELLSATRASAHAAIEAALSGAAAPSPSPRRQID